MIRVLTFGLQVIGSWLFGFVLVYMLGIGNGWEILAIPLATAVAVFVIGGVFNRRMLTLHTFLMLWFIAGIGGLIMSTGILRVFGIFLPFIGAIGTYWYIVLRLGSGMNRY